MKLRDVYLAIEEQLAGGPLTLEALFVALSRSHPHVSARGMPALERLLAHHPRVTRSRRTYRLVEEEGFEVRAPKTPTRPKAVTREDTYVVIDIEANPDHPDPAEHEIVELAACVVRDGQVVDTFSRLARPERPLSPEFVRLTQITEDLLAEEAVPVEQAVTEFLDFVGERPLVAHNGLEYDFPLLDATCARLEMKPPRGERLDSLELAHLVFPRAGMGILPNRDGSDVPDARSLDALARHFGLSEDHPDRHRALRDVELTVEVVHRMLAQMREQTPVRLLQRWILERSGHGWAVLLPPGERQDLVLLVEDVEPLPFERPERPTPPHPSTVLGPDGLMARLGREHRESQERMARDIFDALCSEDSRPLLIEAPTGTGKTLGYLTPAVIYAIAARTPVAIAAHTKVLQDQIVNEILELAAALGERWPIRWTVVKGVQNYVDLVALAARLDSPPGPADEAIALAYVVGWVATTPTGDWDDLRSEALAVRNQFIRKLTFELSRQGPVHVPVEPLDEHCFHRRATLSAPAADVVVMNHALVATANDEELFAHLVLDEAHQFEDAATSALTLEVTAEQLDRLLAAVHDPAEGWGTLARWAWATGTGEDDESLREAFKAHASCRKAEANLAAAAEHFIRENEPLEAETLRQYGTSRRVLPSDRHRTGAPELQAALVQASNNLRLLAYRLGLLTVPADVRPPFDRRRLEREIRDMGERCRGVATALDMFRQVAFEGRITPSRDQRVQEDATAKDLRYVAVLDLRKSEPRQEAEWGVRLVPLRVGDALAAFWRSLETLVLTSATLFVAGSTAHIQQRLGLGACDAKGLPSPWDDMSERALVVLTEHLPAPVGSLMEDFTKRAAHEIAKLILVARGRTLALFTAHSRLARTAEVVRGPLASFELEVLVQGEAASRRLLERMRTETNTSLLGTKSFWEGVDVPGEALSQVVIEKLPFDPPNDPVVQARAEDVEWRGGDPFADYLLPRAVLGFRQGFGRLIRSGEDRGVCVVLDNRLTRPEKGYASKFLDSLGDVATVTVGSTAKMLEAVASHLGTTVDTDALERLSEMLGEVAVEAQLRRLEIGDDDLADEELIRERLEAARELLGFSSWRPGQLEVMMRFIRNEDVLAVLPTGSGKSLTYILPALLRPGLTLVVSPLMALMRDQVRALERLGINLSKAITSDVPRSEQEEILRRALRGDYKILFVSPERLWSPRLRRALRQVGVSRVAVDEAHCIDQWGYTFRPEYSVIADALADIGSEGARPAVLATTATASPQTQQAIRTALEMRGDHTVVADADRPELVYYVEDCVDSKVRDTTLLLIVEAFRRRPAIVYVPTRRDAERLAALLRTANHRAEAYHGGMERARRLHVEQDFMDGAVDVVVATKAFGMGIDKPDIELVVHLEMPPSLEEYIQETGRAARGARDGIVERGVCVLLRHPRDCSIHKHFVRNAAPEAEVVRRIARTVTSKPEWLGTLEKLIHDAYSDRGGGFARGRDDEQGEEAAALAVHYLVQEGVVERRPDITWRGRLVLHPDIESRITDYWGANDPERAEELLRLLRKIYRLQATYSRTHVYDYWCAEWSRGIGIPPEELEDAILDMTIAEAAAFSTYDTAIHLVRMGADVDWHAIDKLRNERIERTADAAHRAREFSRSDGRCRRARLLEHLGFDTLDRCDACDVCRPDLPRPWQGVGLDQAALRDATPAEFVVLSFVADHPARHSVNTVAKVLSGEGLPHEWKKPVYRDRRCGLLSHMGTEGVSRVIASMVEEGLIEIVEKEYEGIVYDSPRLTQRGRDMLG
ncbi:MAG: hypothetical protein KatS3mg008_1675 [Acidimicrobiales bacterium]|nr:MAG: hypothetical protein KatS3mg008_1675 [Acidimicrobiales bacterium]